MKKAYIKYSFAIILIGFMTLGAAQFSQPIFEKSTDSLWPEVKKEMRPWTRWWWMGNAVDETNLERELKHFKDAGMGGVEITPIYGVKGYEDSFIDFLSPRWMEVLDYTIKEAGEKGLGVDINMGTGWPFGGPEITPQLAAGKLIVKKFSVEGGKKVKKDISLNDTTQKDFNPKLVALTAYNENNQTVSLLENIKGDNQLEWKSPKGKWTVYAAFGGNTGQMVKRAAPGGEGLSMDHLGKEPIQVYLNKFDEAFQNRKDIGIRSYFNDSYEVYDADFSPNIFTEFKELKGYDLRNYIRELSDEDNSDKARRVKSDYRDIMAHMLLDNFTEPWAEWITEHSGLSRNQAHGSPGNIIDLYAAVDIPEPEVFGLNKLPLPNINYYSYNDKRVPPDEIMIKFASSAAHLLGKPLVSCETFTWLGEHFQVPLSHAKPQVAQTFLTGVNHIFYHGTTYSPEEDEWPGWLFYASTNFAPSNSQWPHVKGLNDYITRCQSILQSGKPDSDVLVYFPYSDVVYNAPPELEMQLAINSVDKWLQPTAFYELVENLDNQGLLVDLVSDSLIKKSSVSAGAIHASKDGVHYKTLIIPPTEFMPVETFQNILDLAQAGANIIFTKLPADVPGLHNLDERRSQLQQLTGGIKFKKEGNLNITTHGQGQILLSEIVGEALAYLDISGEKIAETGLEFIRKKIDGGKYYYLVNHTDHAINKWVPLNTSAGGVAILDPQTGESGMARIRMEEGKTSVLVHLIPGETVFLQTFTDKAPVAEQWNYYEEKGESFIVEGPWQLEFTEGGEKLPENKSLDQLTSWTELGDEDAKRFSGTGVYTTTFQMSDLSAETYVLDLGDVRESARVWINNEEIGILWSLPYRANIGSYLKKGSNTIKIEVTNLMANRIIDLDKRGVKWRKFYEINFVNFLYTPFDASGWDWQPSGLLGPVSITALQEKENL